MKCVVMGLLLTALIVVGGCVAGQGVEDHMAVLRGYADGLEEKTEAVDHALEKITELVTKAEAEPTEEEKRSEAAEHPIGAAAAGAVSIGSTFLPPPWNGIVKLFVPFIIPAAGWFMASTKTKRREQEEKLLIAGLRQLKNENPEAFNHFVKYRDAAAKGLMTAKQIGALLDGIDELRAKIA